MGGDGHNRIEISWNHCPLGYIDSWWGGWVSSWLSDLYFCHYSPLQFSCLCYSVVTFIICSHLLIPPLPSSSSTPPTSFLCLFFLFLIWLLLCAEHLPLTFIMPSVSLDLLCLSLFALTLSSVLGLNSLRHYRPTMVVTAVYRLT